MTDSVTDVIPVPVPPMFLDALDAPQPHGIKPGTSYIHRQHHIDIFHILFLAPLSRFF